MEFLVTWPTGQQERDCSETATPDAYAMERWGCESAEHVLTQYGVKIDMVEAQEPAPEPEPKVELTAEQLAALQAADAPPVDGEQAPVQ